MIVLHRECFFISEQKQIYLERMKKNDTHKPDQARNQPPLPATTKNHISPAHDKKYTGESLFC
jgi:hypothetical protein